MIEYTRIMVPALGRRVVLNGNTIDGEELKFGNFEQSHVVARIQTHKGRKIVVPEVGEVFGGRVVTYADFLTVRYKVLNREGEREVKRAYFLRRYKKELINKND